MLDVMQDSDRHQRGSVSPERLGTVVAIRSNVVDVRFNTALPAIHDVLRAGPNGQIAAEVVSHLDPKSHLSLYSFRFSAIDRFSLRFEALLISAPHMGRRLCRFDRGERLQDLVHVIGVLGDDPGIARLELEDLIREIELCASRNHIANSFIRPRLHALWHARLLVFPQPHGDRCP